MPPFNFQKMSKYYIHRYKSIKIEECNFDGQKKQDLLKKMGKLLYKHCPPMFTVRTERFSQIIIIITYYCNTGCYVHHSLKIILTDLLGSSTSFLTSSKSFTNPDPLTLWRLAYFKNFLRSLEGSLGTSLTTASGQVLILTADSVDAELAAAIVISVFEAVSTISVFAAVTVILVLEAVTVFSVLTAVSVTFALTAVLVIFAVAFVSRVSAVWLETCCSLINGYYFLINK